MNFSYLYSIFQYISCCSLSMRFQTTFRRFSDFNTSHVVVYHIMLFVLPKHIQFQYISCCSLSQTVLTNRRFPTAFQYISCCSLSNAFPRFLFFHFTFRPDFSPFFRFLPSATPILFSMSSIA